MNNTFSSKTFNERVQPDLYREYKESREALVERTLEKLQGAREKHEARVAELLPSLATLRMQALETLAFVDDFGVGLKAFKKFTFEQALSYAAPETIDRADVSTIQLCSRASDWVRHRLAGFSLLSLSMPERFQRITALQVEFRKKQEGITTEMFKTARVKLSELATSVDNVRGLALDFPHGRPEAARSLDAVVKSLRAFSQEELLACEMSYRDLSEDGATKKVSNRDMLKILDYAITQVAEGVLESAAARPPGVSEILKQHARAANELKMPAALELNRQENLILRYFSLVESLSNPRLEDGARRRYSEMRDGLVPELQAMNRKDRAHSVKTLQRLGKSAGWEIVPNDIDDSFWATIGGRQQSTDASMGLSGAPVSDALKPYVQGVGRKVAGIRVKDLEREVKVGTVEGVVCVLKEVIGDSADVTAILSANPRLFLDFQKPEKASFAQFVAGIRDAYPVVVTIRARGQEVSASQFCSVESARVLVQGEARRDLFVRAKKEALTTLRECGFEEPEVALAVLRRGTLVKGSYQTVSERTFDDFAKKGVAPADEIKVPAIREQLVRAGLLAKRSDGALSLPVRHDGKRGSLIAWIRTNHPGADVA